MAWTKKATLRGPAGAQGAKGDTGTIGNTGATGAAGTASTVVGPAGPKGGDSVVAGSPGPQGNPGIQGIQGQGLEFLTAVATVGDLPTLGGAGGLVGNVHLVNADGKLYTPVSGAWASVGHVQGPAGPPGSDGSQGPIGLTGPKSTTPGPPGVQGTQGDAGGPGPAGADSTVPGPAGHIGIPGVPGSAGPRGPAGVTSVTAHPGSTAAATVNSAGVLTLTLPRGPAGTTTHAGLTDVTSDQHHARYTNAEAVRATDPLYLKLAGGTMSGDIVLDGHKLMKVDSVVGAGGSLRLGASGGVRMHNAAGVVKFGWDESVGVIKASDHIDFTNHQAKNLYAITGLHSIVGKAGIEVFIQAARGQILHLNNDVSIGQFSISPAKSVMIHDGLGHERFGWDDRQHVMVFRGGLGTGRIKAPPGESLVIYGSAGSSELIIDKNGAFTFLNSSGHPTLWYSAAENRWHFQSRPVGV